MPKFNPDRALPRVEERLSRDQLEQLAQKAGYQVVNSIEELGLTKDDLRQAIWTGQGHPREGVGNNYFIASRQDGQQVRVIAFATNNRCIATDIFSPAFYEGHGGNHDFSLSEFTNNLRLALEGDVYKK